MKRLRWVLTEVKAAGADAIFMANDHTAVLPENLACFLRGVDPSEATYAGRALAQRRGNGAELFNSGAAGYVITKATLDAVDAAWGQPPCAASDGEKWLQGNPGLVFARCFSAHGVPPADTRRGSRHVFHAFGPVRTATGRVDDWFARMHETLPFSEKSSPVPNGLACCDAFSVSFHYVEAKEQRALFAATRTTFSNASAADAWLVEHWPRTGRDLGGYSHPLPRDDAQRAAPRDLITGSLELAGPGTCPVASVG